MTNADVCQYTAVVHIIVSAVRRLVVVGRNAFNLRRSAKIGRSITEDNQATPLAAGVVRNRAVKGVTFKREDDGTVCCAFCEKLSPFRHDHRCSVRTCSGSTFHDGAGLNGQGLSRLNEDIAVQNVVVVACPSGRACTCTHV